MHFLVSDFNWSTFKSSQSKILYFQIYKAKKNGVLKRLGKQINIPQKSFDITLPDNKANHTIHSSFMRKFQTLLYCQEMYSTSDEKQKNREFNGNISII